MSRWHGYGLLNWLIISLVVICVGLRFAWLPHTPPGFYHDETAGGAHIVSLLRTGRNAYGQSWPFYSVALGGGYTTPIYLYLATGWASIFGASELALRAFSVTISILAVGLVALTASLWFDRRIAWLTALSGLLLPWSWLQGSLAWDPALVPLWVAGAMAIYSYLYHRRPSLRLRILWLSLLAINLLILAYSYPPCRVTAPILLLAMDYNLWRQKVVKLTHLLVCWLPASLLSLPLIKFMLTPEALQRSRFLSVFYHTTVWHGLYLTLLNFCKLLSPDFLFGHGDANLRHSTGYQGMLGYAAFVVLIGGLLTILFKRPKRWPTSLVFISFVGILSGLLGSALTNESQPHSLRATAAWPFWLLLIAFCWWLINTKLPRVAIAGCLTVVVITGALFAYDLRWRYPTRSAGYFETANNNALIHGGIDMLNSDGLTLRYYQLQYHR